MFGLQLQLLPVVGRVPRRLLAAGAPRSRCRTITAGSDQLDPGRVPLRQNSDSADGTVRAEGRSSPQPHQDHRLTFTSARSRGWVPSKYPMAPRLRFPSNANIAP